MTRGKSERQSINVVVVVVEESWTRTTPIIIRVVDKDCTKNNKNAYEQCADVARDVELWTRTTQIIIRMHTSSAQM